MSRWHAPACRLPDVHVAASGVPYCDQCGESAEGLLQKATKAQESSSSIPLVPPDEPPGQLNLWWPPSAPYTSESSSNRGTENTRPIKDASSTTTTDQIHPQPPERGVGSSRDPIYPKSLAQNEFRLACLSSALNGSKLSPVHISLESFMDDHHPDYDTVSYTWGGEDNDSSRSQPVYVGDFWDILLTTRNCWAMLRYLRPWRGTRLVWVDIICINQSDLKERGQQVAKMDRIYSQCNQVVLWLGDDLVNHTQAELPPRRRFDELTLQAVQTHPAPVSSKRRSNLSVVDRILARRYFSRVWVIQELILSPRVQIPFGDKVFAVNPYAPGRWSWEMTPAPWFKLAARGMSHGQSWLGILHLTSKSNASDARDRLYGVLGLLYHKDGPPIPDYTISYQHMMTGLLTFWLINTNEIRLLHAARGVSSGISNMPSWMLPWDRKDCWVQAQKRMNKPKVPQSHFKDDIKPWGTIGSYEAYAIQSESPRVARGCFQLVWNIEGDQTKWNHTVDAYTGACVDSNMGGLSLRAIKLASVHSFSKVESAPFEDQPSILSSYIGLLRGSDYRNARVGITSEDNLEELVVDGDELFVLGPGVLTGRREEQDLFYVILRRVSDGKYTLVTSTPYVCFYLRGGSTRPDIYGASFYNVPLHTMQGRLPWSIADLKRVWENPLYTFDEDLGSHGKFGQLLQQVFPGNKETPFHAIVPILLGDKRRFEQLLQNPVAQKLGAKITSDILELSFAGKESTAFPDIYYEANQPDPSFGNLEWLTSWTPSSTVFGKMREKGHGRVECPVSNVVALLQSIDDRLRISEIWGLTGATSPKGSWEELLQADSIWGWALDLNAYDGNVGKKMCGVCGLSGIESLIQII